MSIFERSNLLAQAKLETEDKEIMDLVRRRENANRNVRKQLDDQIVKLMKTKNIEDARKKAAELARMEYEQITKSLTDQISFLEKTEDFIFETKIKNRLLLEPGIYSNNYNVDVFNGNVYIMGISSDIEEKTKIENFLNNMNDIKKLILFVDIQKRLQ